MTNRLTTIIWDFDGVIIESMSVRDDAFRHALQDYPEDQIEELILYHRKNGGLSRFHKFRYFYREICRQPITEERLEMLAGVFSKYCLERLMKPDCLIEESVRFIRQHHEKTSFHIASGSAEVELNQICEGLGIRSYFGDVRGSPTPKVDLVAEIIVRRQLDKRQTALVGDAGNDYEAACANGIAFYGFRNESLQGRGSYLENFDDLPV